MTSRSAATMAKQNKRCTTLHKKEYQNAGRATTTKCGTLRGRATQGVFHTSTNLYSARRDSPWRAGARLGSAHARNYRGCRQIETVNATQYCQGVHFKKSRLNRERKPLGSDSMNQHQFFGHPAHDDEQQQEAEHCCCSNNSSVATAAVCMYN